MSTITLYRDKLNGVGSFIDNIISSLNGLDSQLDSLKTTLQGIDSSTCDLQSTVDSISSSSKSENEKIDDLKRLNNKITDFIGTVSGRDSSAKSEINRAKDDFYTTYGYLKPDCEKSKWERRWETICGAVEAVGDWCKKHWKIIVTVVIVAIAVAVLVFLPGVGALIAGACWGAILGAVIGGVSGGIMSAVKGGSFWDGFEKGAFDGAIGGAIGGAITGGLTAALGPTSTMLGSIGRGAGLGALSSGTSNMCVTALDYGIEHGTLKGSLDDILLSGLSGALSGGIMGGITGGIQFKLTIKGIEKYGLKVENGKVDGKIPLKDYLKYRDMSINNPNSDTMTLGKYRPSINPDGTENWAVPGPDAYVTKAGDTTYFSLGTEWDKITNQYGLDKAGKDMFKLFNIPALDDAANAGKTIRFSHDPTAYGDCALKWEWDHLMGEHGFTGLIQMGDFWYGIK